MTGLGVSRSSEHGFGSNTTLTTRVPSSFHSGSMDRHSESTGRPALYPQHPLKLFRGILADLVVTKRLGGL